MDARVVSGSVNDVILILHIDFFGINFETLIFTLLFGVTVVIDGQTWSVPINAEGNRHWKAIQAWVAEGNTIAEAE